MKTNSKLVFAGILSVLTFFASAQGNKGTLRPVSKEIQKVNSKAWLLNEPILTVVSVGTPALVVSKKVQLTSNKVASVRQIGNLISTGYPLWTISKGVHNNVKNPTRVEKIHKPLQKEFVV